MPLCQDLSSAYVDCGSWDERGAILVFGTLGDI